MSTPLLPLHISLTDWDGILVLGLGFGPFLMIAAVVMFLRTRDFDEETEGQHDS